MSTPTPGRNVVLIGLMGVGKSTVGKLVAKALGRPFVDTDRLIEAEQHLRVADIFSQRGEAAFRTLEADAVRRVSATGGQVIAVGGGAVLDPANVHHLRAGGELILLDAEPAVLAGRVSANLAKRPLLAGDADPAARLTELREQRQHAYLQAADTVVDTSGRSTAQVVAAVLDWLAQRPGALADDEHDRGGRPDPRVGRRPA